MPKKPAPTNEEFSHLHIEIDTVVLNEVRRLNPGYGDVSSLIRKLLKEYLRHAFHR
jgi:hypothetical protein